MSEIITKEMLKDWNACKDGYELFCELFPDGSDLQKAIKAAVERNHNNWGFWLFNKCRENNLFSALVSKGYMNTGDMNTGDMNTGDWNTGYRNTGNRNTGNRNTENWNTGDMNTGDRNTGYMNTGDWNTGNRNTGYRNTGNRNTGDWNTGDRNAGNKNTGDWNTGDRNAGYMNTKTPDQILVYNTLCNRAEWDNCYKPSFLYFDLTYWVNESEMTDKDKVSDPNFYVRGGQLCKKDYKEAFKESWDKAEPEDRIKVKDLPNFDAEVFYEISGIDLRDDK